MHLTTWDTRVAPYAVVVDPRDRLMLARSDGRRPRPRWTLPGGGVRVRETGGDGVLGRSLTTSTWPTTDDAARAPHPCTGADVVDVTLRASVNGRGAS